MTKRFEKSCLIHFWMIVFLLLFAGFSFAEQNAEQNQTASAGTGPSFDCAKAKTEVEKLICGSGELSKMDLELSETYKKIATGLGYAEKASLKKKQIEWIRGRTKKIEEGILPADKPEDAQKKKEANLKKEYEARLSVIKTLPGNADAGKTAANQNQEKSRADKASVSGEKPQDKKLADSASQNQSASLSPVKTEGEKAQRVKAILTNNPFVIHPDFCKDPKFCKEFFEALKSADKSMEYIEPVVRTDDPNHPEIKRYDIAASKYDNVGRDDESRFFFIDLKTNIGERAFRIYRVDLDGNFKNGLEEYIYAELDRNVDINPYKMPGYTRVDLDESEIIDRVPVNQGLSGSPKNDEDNYNALVRFRGEYYIFDLYQHNTLNIVKYSKRKKCFESGYKCLWTTNIRFQYGKGSNQ